MMALADNAAWLVILAHIGPVLLAVTTSLHIDFLRKPDVTDLLARARLIKLGKRLAVVDVDLFSRGSDELVAKASGDVLDTSAQTRSSARSSTRDRAAQRHRQDNLTIAKELDGVEHAPVLQARVARRHFE